MDDNRLIAFLGLDDPAYDPAKVRAYIADLRLEKRELYERMAEVCAEINAGLLPGGVILCRQH